MKVTYLTADGRKECFQTSAIEVLDSFGDSYVIGQDYDGWLKIESGIHGYSVKSDENVDNSITVTTLKS